MIFEKNNSSAIADTDTHRFISNQLGLTERIVSMIPWTWRFTQASYHGRGTKRQPFEPMDEVLCEMLLLKDGMELEEIQQCLGLNDDMGRKVLMKMLKPLTGKMIAGDVTYYSLTDKGKLYAQEGTKYEEFASPFTLVVDLQNPNLAEANQLADSLGKAVQNRGKLVGESVVFGEGLWERFLLAQARKVFDPEKGYYLDDAVATGEHSLEFPIRLVLIEDFDEQSWRWLALAANEAREVEQISRFLNSPEATDLREEMVHAISMQATEDGQIIEKPAAQLEDEKFWQAAKSQLENLPESSDERTQSVAIEQLKEQRCSFDTLEFEQELLRIEKQCQDEIWLISPWVRKAAFQQREKMISTLLDRGCKVFLGYSAPHHEEEEMTEGLIEGQLKTIWRNNPHFFFAELPSFHEKIVLADLKGKKYEYTGSFNVLSFSAHSKTQISRENMRRLPWGPDSEEHHQYFRQEFAKPNLAMLYKRVEELFTLTQPKQLKSLQDLGAKLSICDQKADAIRQWLPESEWEHLAERRREWKERLQALQRQFKVDELNQLLGQVQGDAFPAGSPANLKRDWETAKSHFPGIDPPNEADLSTEFSQHLVRHEMRQKLAALGTKVKNMPEEITIAQKQSLEKEWEALKNQGVPERLEKLCADVHQSILAKTVPAGLTVVGKVDLPEEKKQHHSNKKKNKNKNKSKNKTKNR